MELQRHGLESVEREVRWLNELIDAERAGAVTPAQRKSKTRDSKPNRDLTEPSVHPVEKSLK